MQTLVYPFHKTSTGKYQNNFGEFPLESVTKDSEYEFFLSEDRSGLFRLVDTKNSHISSTHNIPALCPHHCMQELIATDKHTFICPQCDPRLV